MMPRFFCVLMLQIGGKVTLRGKKYKYGLENCRDYRLVGVRLYFASTRAFC